MTTPAQTDNTSPTTGDTPLIAGSTGAGRPAPRRNGTNGRRPNRPLVAPTRTAPHRSRGDAAAPAQPKPEPAVDEAVATSGQMEVATDEAEPAASIATRVARAPRTPRRPRATGAGATSTKAQEVDPEVDREVDGTTDIETTDIETTDIETTEIENVTEVDADAGSEDETDAETTSSTIPRRSLTVGIAAVVAAALIVALAYSLWHTRTVDAENGRLSAQSKLGASALTAATTYGGYLSSYDYKTLHSANSAWTQVENNATASFKKDFTSTSGSLGNLLTQYNATATGKVVAAGIQSVSSTRAVVLLFIDQTVTNTVQKPNSVTQPLRVQLTMVRQSGKWLIDNLQVPN
jgi:Mce-associated membrane protein